MSDHRTRVENGVLAGGQISGPEGASPRPRRHDGLTGPPRGRVADSGKKPPAQGKAQNSSGSKVGTREITLVGTFKNPFPKLADEVAAMKARRWEPTTDDFAAVAGKSYTVNSYLQILGTILVDGDKEVPDGSISRINLFTHANSDLIALQGTVSPLSVGSDVRLGVPTALSVDTLDKINQEGVTFTVASNKLGKKPFTMDDVRRKFGKDAVIVIYACHSGLDGAFIQYLANTFEVRVKGFSSVIGYFPAYSENPVKVDRKKIGLGFEGGEVLTDFHDLDKRSGVIEKTPRH
jgi:hypothetical protein